MFNFDYVRRAFNVSRYGRIALIVLFIGLIVGAGSFAGTLQPNGGAEAALTKSLKCSGPATGVAKTPVTFTASGGDGTYLWTFGQNKQEGQTYVANFANPGPKTVTVTSGDQSADCIIQISANGDGGGTDGPSKPWSVSCSGSPSTINPGGTVTWTAKISGGNGPAVYTVAWSGNGSFPSGVTGNPVQHTYLGAAGQRNAHATVTSGDQSQTADCDIQVVEPTSGNPGRPGNPGSTNCSSLQYGTIALNANTATVRVSNPNPAGSNCAQSIGFVSYDTSAEPYQGSSNRTAFIANQHHLDHDIKTVAPGANDVTFAVSIPQCEFQVDLYKGSIVPTAQQLDTANGVELLENKWIVSSGISTQPGRECPVRTPPPPQVRVPVCSPSTQTINVNQQATLNASGGNGNYSWSVVGGSPSTGSGTTFRPSFSAAGSYLVNLASNGVTDQCTVVVRQQISNISCLPLNQTVGINENAHLTASGGDGAFHWVATGGSPSTGSGATFQTKFASDGPKPILVSDNSGHQAQCNVQVNPGTVEAPVCSPSSRNASVGERVDFSATHGNGSFSWSAPDGSPETGTSPAFHTTFSDSGTFVVNVTSNGLTDSCIVHIDDDEDEDDLSCSSSDQNVDVGDFVTFRASGGSAPYRWTADEGDADPDSDTGRTFTTQFDDEGRFTVRVRDSEGRTATCHVNIEDDFTARRPSCTPSSQSVAVGEQVEFFANGGTGDFEWDARNGQPRSGFGRRFTTSYNSPGRYEVELDSNGETDTCEVEVRPQGNGSLFCSPSSQNANVGDFVAFSATGGNGNYSWNTTSDGTPTTGSTSSFGTRFTTPGTKFVTVNSNGVTSQCVVQIGSVLGASTIVTGPEETAAAAAGLGLLGALGAYGAVYRERTKKFLAKVRTLIRR